MNDKNVNKDFNSSWPNDTIWHHRSKPSLDQVRACHLFRITWTNDNYMSIGPMGTNTREILEVLKKICPWHEYIFCRYLFITLSNIILMG